MKKKKNPDIIFLMETTNKVATVEKIRCRLGFKFGFNVTTEGLSGGLALWWREEFIVNVLNSCKNYIVTLVEDTVLKCNFRVCWVYGAPVFEDRRWFRRS